MQIPAFLQPIVTGLLMVLVTITDIAKAVVAVIFWVLFKPFEYVLKYTPANSFINRVTKAGSGEAILEHIAAETAKLKESADDLLVHGKRREYAERLLPPAQHPTWYTDVPRHLRRSIVEHGRIRETGYAPAQFLAGEALTGEFVIKAWDAAVTASIRAGWLVLVISFASFVGYFGKSAVTGGFNAPAVESVSKPSNAQANASRMLDNAQNGAKFNSSAFSVAHDYKDVWTPAEADEVASKVAAASVTGHKGADWGNAVYGFVNTSLRTVLLAIAALGVALAAARMVFLGRFRWIVESGVEREVKNLRKPFREALQKWRYFLADRKTHDKGYNDQVHFATKIDRSPLIYFGDAEGETEFAGHLLAPREGTGVQQSVVDMLQHTMVLGGSGEAKSRDVYIPVMAQLLELRKAGYPIATYVTDDKGAIVEDVKSVAAKLGLTDDLLVIGTGKDEWRVDLMEAGKPYLVAEFIKSAARQAGAGAGGDDFWPEMGNDLMLNVMTITEAAERTTAGEAWVAEHGIRLHSLKNILTLATVDSELETVIGMVIGALQAPAEYARIADLDNDALDGAISYLLSGWLPMTEATRDGIRANLRKALRTFTFKPEVARGFADGAGEKLLPASQMHSNKIKVLNVSQIEHGSAGRLVNIMMKSMFFKQARDAQQQNPAAADARLAWWFNPDLSNPKKDEYYLEFFLADEYQSLITADSTSGYSDLTAWNVLRSAGVAGFTISQGLGAYEAAIGREATGNILRQWRTKHFLRTEDLATIDEARKLVGKSMRFQVSDWNHYESNAAVRRELGTDADNIEQAQWLQTYDEPRVLGHASLGHLNFGTWDDAFGIDERFVVGATPVGGQINTASAVASQQSAAWRQEDRNSSAMQHGVLDTDVVRDEQLMQMTRGRSLSLVQVGGGTVVDIIRLNAKAYKTYTSEDMVADAE